ncbi:hypothetical protein [Dorea formicigenerans]|nr:hypothetical protein [Dorea formicigenerans]
MVTKSALPDNWPMNKWQNENNVEPLSVDEQYEGKEICFSIVPQ